MSSTKHRFGVLAMVAGLLVALALGSVAAQALGDMGFVQRGETLAGKNTLTVSIASNENNKSYADDLAKANTVLDVYKVADGPAEDAYGTTGAFQLVSPYASEDNTRMMNEALSGMSDWEKLAESLAGQVTNLHAEGSMNVGASLSNLENGLYLVLPHGTDTTKELKSHSDYYTYAFSPILVCLPSPKPNANGVRILTNTMTEESLEREITVTLKSRRIVRYGALQITKDVTEPSTEDATFVFHITGTTPAGDAYDNYASVTLKAGEKVGTTEVTHVPAGTQVTVVEDYAAGRYDLGTVTVGSQGNTIIADSTITFSCTNTPTTKTFGGHGIQNNFEYNKNENGDWGWTPDQKDHVVEDADKTGNE